MTTIEERAYGNYPKPDEGYKDLQWRERIAYVAGATEQRAIDIEKACQWLECYGDDARWEKPSDKIKEFRRAMEE